MMTFKVEKFRRIINYEKLQRRILIAYYHNKDLRLKDCPCKLNYPYCSTDFLTLGS
jgi:hypothetical protein